jgi:hypothetical protein
VSAQGVIGLRAGDLAFSYHNDSWTGPNPIAWATDTSDYGWTGGGVLSLKLGDTLVDIGHETFTGLGLGYKDNNPDGRPRYIPDNPAHGAHGTHAQDDDYACNRADTFVRFTDLLSGYGLGLHWSSPAFAQNFIHDYNTKDCARFALPDVMGFDGATTTPLSGLEPLTVEVFYQGLWKTEK